MKINREEVLEILGKIRENSSTGKSVSNEIAQLLMATGVKKGIINNPNSNSIPKEVYAAIQALTEFDKVTVKDGRIEIYAPNAMVLQDGEKKPTEVILIIEDGKITLKQFYKTDYNEANLKVTEVNTGRYTNGEEVVRTLSGEYTLKDPSSYASTEYTGNASYIINEFASDGVQMGTRVISGENNPSKSMTSLTAGSLIGQDLEVRRVGLYNPISADNQKDLVTVHDRSPYITGEFLYYRDSREVDKFHVIENYDSVRSGVEFALFGEHGTDDIRRIGVVEDISEERYESERQQFYSDERNIEEAKAKSPLASKRIDESVERFKESRNSFRK